LAGKPELARRLLGSLPVDAAKARALLGWRPAVSVDVELRACVEKSGG
jgi:nucleoside-diphosphate-sugar epimerase